MTAELLDEGPEDATTVLVSWLLPMALPGGWADTRRAGDPLPGGWVEHLESREDIECGTVDALMSIHVLCDKNLGGPDQGHVPARDQKDAVHRRMLLLARYNEDVMLDNGRAATIDSVSVAAGFKKAAYLDDQIIHYVGRYQIGLSYSSVP